MTWAAAATERVGLGTTVLVLPLRPPVLLAKMIASLDLMSGGRVTVGAAGGWLKGEFDALGVPFEERGARTDETIEIMRRCWFEDPINADAPVTGVKMVEMRAKPQPGRAIPIWIGGHSEPAYRRAVAGRRWLARRLPAARQGQGHRRAAPRGSARESPSPSPCERAGMR